MNVEGFLKYCARVPYNSAIPDLPSIYQGNLSYGLDCKGFTQLYIEEFPSAEQIHGTYGDGKVHVAVIHDGMFVDPFLRMRQPVAIGSNGAVPTYYKDSIVRTNLEGDWLTVILQRHGKILNRYKYPPTQYQLPDQKYQIFPYRFTFLNNLGLPVTITNIRLANSFPALETTGEYPDTIESLLRHNYGLTISDIDNMFHDAASNALYQSALRDMSKRTR